MTATPIDEDEFLLEVPVEFAALAGDVRDPYPDLARERDATPIKKIDLNAEFGLVQDPSLPKPPDIFTVFSYDLVRQVFSDNETFSSSCHTDVMGPVIGHTILMMDAPEHPKRRALVASAFRMRMIQKWSDTLLKATVDELIDRFIARGKTDLVSSLTFPFPVRVISRILGLPESDWKQFQQWSVDLISVNVNLEKALNASRELGAYFDAIVDERRVNPADDVISHLATAEFEGDRLTNEEINSFLRLLLPAGAETTFRSSGNLLYLLMTHQETLEAVRADRSLVAQTIEEALRFEAPLLYGQRSATKGCVIDGTEVDDGALVAMSIGAANRDPKRWENPDVFDIYREQKQHISFAAGPHLCLGTHLARAEMTVLLNCVLDRLPDLRLDPAGDDPHIHGMIFRSPTSLPVLFTPPAG